MLAIRHWQQLQMQLIAACTRYSATASPSSMFSSDVSSADPDEGAARVSPATSSAEPLITVSAAPREFSGTTISVRMRRAGLTPAILFSLPDNQSKLLQLDSRSIQRLVDKVGRLHITSRVMDLEVKSPSSDSVDKYRVLPRQLHVDPVTDQVENVTFMHLRPGRRFNVEVPVQVVGQDVSPGVRRGGWPHVTARTIGLSCPSENVLPYIEVDVSNMDLGNSLIMQELENMLPDDVHVLSKDPLFPVCKIRGRARD